MKLERLGFAYNPTSEAALELRERAAGWCQLRGIAHWAAPAGEFEALVKELPTTSVVVVLGGDGTFLRAARAVAEVDVPLLGVNLGKVGFLSKVEAHELETILAQVAGGDYRIEERMALRATIHPGGRAESGETFFALNDITVARGSLARVCRLEVAIGASHLATFIADGLVVASPTGSTGYSFSAGGPIVDPMSRNLVVTPIAGYLSAIRSVVVSPRQTVRCRVLDAYEALVSIDGREDRPLQIGDVVAVAALYRSIRFVEPRGAVPFWDLLRQKVELLPS
ncbi:MAG TPA: NAD(+)/NADH kinase [Candidatus Limnocylindrales bacterium]